MGAMPERREADRRGDERRAFRQQTGRRGDRPVRRGSRRRRRRLLLLLVLLALAGFALRVAVVAPRRAAAGQAIAGQVELTRILGAVEPATLALRGARAPSPGPPSHGPLVLEGPDAALLQGLEADLAGPLRRFPGELVLAQVLGPSHLLLGHDVDARRAWESLLAQGDPAQQSEARLGLGLVALRAGLRADQPQDRGFAFDQALWHFDAILEGAPEYAAARFDRAVVLIELERYDQAREAILTVAVDDPARAAVLGTHLVRREPTPDPPSRPPP